MYRKKRLQQGQAQKTANKNNWSGSELSGPLFLGEGFGTWRDNFRKALEFGAKISGGGWDGGGGKIFCIC